ncbi:MAG: AGE family epimerase/isomerase [Bacteroidales bacterium]|nr:AGE family epimerase/isomerase [Bacteroidales bacterium]
MTLDELKQEVSQELTSNILPYWIENMTDPRGGYYGRRDGNGKLIPEAEKGLILNSRILWTFSQAFRILGKPEYLEAATRAANYIAEHFVDREFGGAYWSVDAAGNPLDTKKQFYAIAFAVYGLAEYYRASGGQDALDLAISLYQSIEEHSFDAQKNGYIEACTREWGIIEDMRLSEKDENYAKTMNTHLHILEAYTGLYRVWKDSLLHDHLANLIRLFLDKIIQPNGHLGLFFDEDWNLHGQMQSFGHDIETSWLLVEAAEVLCEGGDPMDRLLYLECLGASRDLATAASEGLTAEGMIYEFDPSGDYRKEDRDWWVQAEAVVGYLNRWQLAGDSADLERAYAEWKYIKSKIIAPDGEWYWGRKEDGSVNLDDDRAGFWKCPYHNGRMCLELMTRLLQPRA